MRFTLEDGNALGYEVSGRGAPLVLLHPIGLSRRFWDPAVQEFEDAFRCIAIDLPGHGESDEMGQAETLDDMAAACTELTKELAGPSHVVGCSMGASIAQMMAVNARECVRTLVLANTSGPRANGRGTALEERARLAEKGMGGIAGENIDRWFSAQSRLARPDLIAQVTQWLLAGSPVVHARAWRALAGRRDDHYGDIAVPVLVVAGAQDTSASPRAARVLADAIPQAEIAEIADAGHLAPLEKPREFAAIVKKFVQSH